MQPVVYLLAVIALSTVVVQGGMEKLIRVRRDTRVQRSYFVHIKEEVSVERAREFVKELEQKASNDTEFIAVTHGLMDEAAYGFSSQLSKKALHEVLDEDIVESVEEDHYIHAGGDSNGKAVFTWGLDRLDTVSKEYDNIYTPPCNLTGEGTDVYVLDSGIWYSHKDFDGQAVYPGCDPIDQLSGTNRSGLDCTGHGSHVAGTIVGKKMGVAPGATVFSVRILNCHNLGTASSVLLGINCVLKKYKERKRPAIVNLSVYGEKDLSVKRAIDQLMKAGITVVSIAGNNENKPRDSCRVAPGSIQGVITASASTKDDKVYVGSNAGVCVDLYAPGTNIHSASHHCDSCREARKGSSMAAPHVTGAIALLLQKCPTISPWRVKHILLSQMVLVNKLDISPLPSKYRSITPNLLLHTSSLQCDLQCHY